MSVRLPALYTDEIWESFQSVGRVPVEREEFMTRSSAEAIVHAVDRSRVGEIPSHPGALCEVRFRRLFCSHPRLTETGGSSGIGKEHSGGECRRGAGGE